MEVDLTCLYSHPEMIDDLAEDDDDEDMAQQPPPMPNLLERFARS